MYDVFISGSGVGGRFCFFVFIGGMRYEAVLDVRRGFKLCYVFIVFYL